MMSKLVNPHTTSTRAPGYLSTPSTPVAHPIPPIETLPNELLYRVATFIPANSMTVRGCDSPDRFQLALVNKRLYGACTPLLYEYVFLGTYRQLFNFHLSAGVARESWRTVCLVVSYASLFKYSDHPRGTTWSALLFPFTQMQSLRELVLDRSGENCDHFEEGHPVLNYLLSKASHPSFFPHLSILEIPYYPALLSLCRGRPLTSVSLGLSPRPVSDESFDEFISELEKTTSYLNELSLTVPMEGQTEQANSRVRKIVAVCPRPQVVNLKLPPGILSAWNPNTFETAFMDWVRTTLAPWTQLTHLSIRTSMPIIVSMRTQEAIIGALVKIMPGLKYVILPVVPGEWTRSVSREGIPEWTPRPDLGAESINWWFKALGVQRGAYIQSSDNRNISDDISSHSKVDEEVARVRGMMRKWWDEAVIPSPKLIRVCLVKEQSNGVFM
ncbi:hypothetical protein FS749_000064 [Ceratobasidium sp. UAMH 11750]|nr:hypothetical protein FS749_000064 [Ceratobasidium sp. UAMH 11750]